MNTCLETTPRTRLALANVAAPIVLDVEARRADGLTVARSLPFLGLGSAVHDEDGRLAHIESVHVEIDEEIPRLVMDLAYAHAGRDCTVSYTTPSRLPPPPALPQTREGTLLFHTPHIESGEERLSTAPVQLYEDADALKDGLVSTGRGLLTVARALVALSWRGFVASMRLVGQLSARVWRASWRLGATYAGAPASSAAPATD